MYCSACHVLKWGKRSNLICAFLVRLFSRTRPINVRKSNNEICALFILTQHKFHVKKKKNELFLAKVKPIVSLERPKLTGTRPNRWVSFDPTKLRGTDWQGSESQAFSFQVVLWFRVRCCYYFVFHLQSARTFGNCSSQSTFLFLT